MRVARALLLVGILAAATPGTAAAVPPQVSIQASATWGAAPLHVTLAAVGDTASYRWDFGDGTSADGAVVEHTYERAARYRAVVTATNAGGESARAETAVTAFSLVLSGPRVARYGSRVSLRGKLVPATGRREELVLRSGQGLVTRTRGRTNGSFRLSLRLRSPGPYQASFRTLRSNPVPLAVRPIVKVALSGPGIVGRPLALRATVRPKGSGELHVWLLRGGRVKLARVFPGSAYVRIDTRRAGTYEVRLSALPAPGYAPAARRLRFGVSLPALAPGARGPSVRLLEERLRELHFALRGVDGLYASDTYEAVLAAQKAYGLPRTGRVDPALWRVLGTARTPLPRVFSGSHLEVDKGRQLLFQVIRGRLDKIVHVSTGATGNTPLGRWRVYRKVPGWDWVLWYPMYFLRGFAVHGYPFVPAYPASHGCVRVPMWLAPSLYAAHRMGTMIYVY